MTKILIVDDNPDAINILTAILDSEYEVTPARDGLEAIQKVRNESPALVLLDIMMPKKDGYEVLKEMKADPKFSKIPVIMLSAKTDPESRNKSFKLGANDYISKPIDPADILQKVKEHLKKSRPPSSST